MISLKLSGISLFIIILISLALGMLCNNVVEGLANERKSNKITAMLANPKGLVNITRAQSKQSQLEPNWLELWLYIRA